jgi:alpha/beta superfamily hydrolase
LGRHGCGLAERLHVDAALHRLRSTLSVDGDVALAGYSFGASVAAQVAAGRADLTGLCLIAPPLAIEGMALPPALAQFGGSLCVVGGTRDEYCPVASLRALGHKFPNAQVTVVEGANHFFFGRLFPLGEAVGAWARAACMS